jgi:hypothetical protein
MYKVSPSPGAASLRSNHMSGAAAMWSKKHGSQPQNMLTNAPLVMTDPFSKKNSSSIENHKILRASSIGTPGNLGKVPREWASVGTTTE